MLNQVKDSYQNSPANIIQGDLPLSLLFNKTLGMPANLITQEN